MSLAHQPSMWDLDEEATLRPLAVTRHHLSHGAWVDHLPGWVQGSDQVLEVLLGSIGWRADRRPKKDGRGGPPPRPAGGGRRRGAATAPVAHPRGAGTQRPLRARAGR